MVKFLENYTGFLTFLGGILSFLGGCFFSFLKARKDEKVIQIENVTKERKEWRIYLRKWLEDFCSFNIDNLDKIEKSKIRSQLISRINLKDEYDVNLLETLDKILKLKEKDEDLIEELQVKISLLLKHDWERVKNETKPFYRKKKSESDLNEIRKIDGMNIVIKKDYKKDVATNISHENFDTEVTKELCTQVTLFPLFASVVIIFHIVEKNYQFNLDEKIIHWFFIFVFNFIFTYIFSGLLDRKEWGCWYKLNISLIFIFSIILIFSLFFSSSSNIRGLDFYFVIISSLVASVYTTVAFRSLNNFFKKLEAYSHRVFAVAMIMVIEFFIIITTFSL